MTCPRPPANKWQNPGSPAAEAVPLAAVLPCLSTVLRGWAGCSEGGLHLRSHYSPNLGHGGLSLKACSLLPLLPPSQTPSQQHTLRVYPHIPHPLHLYKILQFWPASSTLSLLKGAVSGGTDAENQPLTRGTEASLDPEPVSPLSLSCHLPSPSHQLGLRPLCEAPRSQILTSVLTASSEGLIRTTVSKTSLL